MKKYDPTQPVIHLHIIKTAGTSIRHAFKQWHNSGAMLHNRYPVQLHNLLPEEADWNVFSTHFHTGAELKELTSPYKYLEKYSPKADPQFITFFRDPFDQMLSLYNYWNGINKERMIGAYGQKWYMKDIASSFEEFLHNNPISFWDYIPEWKSPETFDDYVFVGSVNHFDKSFKAMTRLLGLPEIATPRELSSGAAPGPDHLRQIYRELRPDYYEAYQHVLDTWMPVWNQYGQ